MQDESGEVLNSVLRVIEVCMCVCAQHACAELLQFSLVVLKSLHLESLNTLHRGREKCDYGEECGIVRDWS